MFNLFQSGPGDLTNIDSRFTGLPVPQSLGACEEYGATFPGFTYINENTSSLSAQTRGHWDQSSVRPIDILSAREHVSTT